MPRRGKELYTYHDPVVPGEYGELVEARDQIPSSSRVASYEDTEGEDGERVHRIARRQGYDLRIPMKTKKSS